VRKAETTTPRISLTERKPERGMELKAHGTEERVRGQGITIKYRMISPDS